MFLTVWKVSKWMSKQLYHTDSKDKSNKKWWNGKKDAPYKDSYSTKDPNHSCI